MESHGLDRTLSEHPFFEGMPPDQLELLGGCGKNVRIDQGQHLFKSGEEANEFFVIREGSVNVEIDAPGNKPIIIQTLVAGQVLGWSWLFPPYIWTFNALAAEPVRAVAMDGRCLRDKCENDHELGYEMLKRFSQIVINRLQATRLQLMDIYRS